MCKKQEGSSSMFYGMAMKDMGQNSGQLGHSLPIFATSVLQLHFPSAIIQNFVFNHQILCTVQLLYSNS